MASSKPPSLLANFDDNIFYTTALTKYKLLYYIHENNGLGYSWYTIFYDSQVMVVLTKYFHKSCIVLIKCSTFTLLECITIFKLTKNSTKVFWSHPIGLLQKSIPIVSHQTARKCCYIYAISHEQGF